ncbi:MAG: hypothetical protein RQ899_13650 [Pseudomonadales bacterium]|nr:hypothetical protein [Pseudomonadales bacterium]
MISLCSRWTSNISVRISTRLGFYYYYPLAFIVVLISAFPASVLAQLDAVPNDNASRSVIPSSTGDNKSITFEAVFFTPYNPVTALDMVEQVPGFTLDEGGQLRGFGGTAGNILINGERPSTKNDSAWEILSRIPASAVSRIDLIRGETGGLDLRGQTVAVNVILGEDVDALRWEMKVRTTGNTDTVNPAGSVSKTGRWGTTRYTLGLAGGEDRFQQPRGVERLVMAGVVSEERFEVSDSQGRDYQGNLNTETRLGSALFHVNARGGREKSGDFEESSRKPSNPDAPRRIFLEADTSDTIFLDLGGDAEFSLAKDYTGKAIALLNYEDGTGRTSLQRLAADERFLSSSRAGRQTETMEIIGRFELDWTGLEGHYLEANLEGTFNSLENALSLFEDAGDGPRELPLPGANTRVEEVRWDMEFTHSWGPGRFVVDSGLSVEGSTISQSGDVDNERSFFFIKPRVILTYTPASGRQFRTRLEREVAQLNFNDFVSSTNFGDNQFDLGNPELSPENTWLFEFTFEQRFGEIGAVNLTLFHHWIDDVQDMLPLTGIFEVPGNIGDGRRWGVETEITLPLDRLGIVGGRLDFTGRWQDSTVTDPVTRRSRVLSGEGEYTVRMDFRQNLPDLYFSWGGMVAVESEIPAFGLDEFVETDGIADTLDVDIYAETTRWFGVRTRLQFGNILNRTFHRDRRVFSGPRDLTPLSFREIRNRKRGPSVELSVTGDF